MRTIWFFWRQIILCIIRSESFIARGSFLYIKKGGREICYLSLSWRAVIFSKAGYASSQIKKVLKQLAIDPRIIKRVVVALYEAEVNIVAHAWERNGCR